MVILSRKCRVKLQFTGLNPFVDAERTTRTGKFRQKEKDMMAEQAVAVLMMAVVAGQPVGVKEGWYGGTLLETLR